MQRKQTWQSAGSSCDVAASHKCKISVLTRLPWLQDWHELLRDAEKHRFILFPNLYQLFPLDCLLIQDYEGNWLERTKEFLTGLPGKRRDALQYNLFHCSKDLDIPVFACIKQLHLWVFLRTRDKILVYWRKFSILVCCKFCYRSVVHRLLSCQETF